MLASVIVACFNHEKFIAECLESVCSQTYNTIELVVVDDCSTDGSYSVAQSVLNSPLFRRRFSRIVLERNAYNQGAPSTWNHAIRLANGELIFLLNSDDSFHPERVEKFFRAWRQEPRFFGFSYVSPINSNREPVRTATATDLTFRVRRLTQTLPMVSWSLLEFNTTVTTGNFVFTRGLFERVGGFEELEYCHDWKFALRAVVLHEPVLISEPLYYYRLHPNNSFLGLGRVADDEANACYEGYVKGALLSAPASPVCLSPHNQGPAFSNLTRLVPTFGQWLSSYNAPYLAGHRTIEFQSDLGR